MKKEEKIIKKQMNFKAKFNKRCKKQLEKEIRTKQSGTAFLMIYKKDIAKYPAYSEDIVLDLAKSYGYNLSTRVENSYCYLYEFTTRQVRKVKYISEFSHGSED